MNVAVYVPSGLKNPSSNFIVETFFPLFDLFPKDRLLIITDVNSDFGSFPNCETITIRNQPGNLILKNIWIERTLAGLLKKIKADVFICADSFCSLNTTLPQYILMPNPERIKPAHAKKARLLIITSELVRKDLISRIKVGEDKIAFVYPPPGKKYSLLDDDERESIKNKYSEGKEYFLCSGRFRNQKDLVDLLKSFSHFKKRQQSSFKLVIVGQQHSSIEKNTENYKYRNDVVALNSNGIQEKAGIMAAAYSLLLPFDTDEDITCALGAMQSGVPLIATKDSSLNEIAGDAALYANNEIKDIGEKMMQLYKDETLRSQLIEKGKQVVKNFTVERVADQLWQSMMKVLN